jgi:hypothetical protein
MALTASRLSLRIWPISVNEANPSIERESHANQSTGQARWFADRRCIRSLMDLLDRIHILPTGGRTESIDIDNSGVVSTRSHHWVVALRCRKSHAAPPKDSPSMPEQ